MILLASGIPPHLPEVVALIVTGTLIAYVCQRVGLVPIVGFLVAGVVIGPHGLMIVTDQELVDNAAEIGVILLLFTIGIEFSLERLARIKTLIFAGGALQVVLATLATAGILALFGVGWRSGIFTGFLVALSSTAIVLKLLAARGETTSPHGQVALGLLIFQDLAIVLMVLLVPMLSGTDGSSGGVSVALAKAGVLIALVLVVARRLMPRLLESVARTCSPELFLLTVIAICFGTAYLTSLAGVSLSLGAFLAGLVVSESSFSQHALGEILPFQILFSAIFFVSVGMLLDLRFVAMHLPVVLAFVAAVLLVKVVTTTASVAALRYPVPVAAASGLMLAQVGEFSFVLERAGREVGLSPVGNANVGSQAFLAATVVLMAGTPLLSSIGARFASAIERRMTRTTPMEPEGAVLFAHAALADHVIVAGYGEAARRLVRVLDGSRIPFLITTLSPGGATAAESEGLPVLRGDASRVRTLEHAGVERAKMLVVADDDPGTARRIVAVARPLNPTMRIVVRARYHSDAKSLLDAGTDRVVTDELESIVALFSEVLSDYRIPAEEILRHEETIRTGSYAALTREGGADEPVTPCSVADDCLATRTVSIRAGAPVAGRRWQELGLEERLGIQPIALRRVGTVIDEEPARWRLEPGDEIVLKASTAAFAESAALFAVDGVVSKAVDGVVSKKEDAMPGQRAEWIDTEKPMELVIQDGNGCGHLDSITPVYPSAKGCEDCLRIGGRWVHLRLCMICGHVGCCDSSPNRHASRHYAETTHPVMRSLERGESWGWCFADQVEL
ncbi:MAG: cation:proton antiporter [Vicinamibacteria bacterium]